MQKTVLIVAGVLSLAIAGGAAWLSLSDRNQPASPASVAVEGGAIGGPFNLIRHDGVPVTQDDVITGPTLVYFGYTFCPDVCPIDVQVMAEATDLLAAEGYEVTPVFVTVDPARDTPEALSYYVDAMHPRMIGLTGSDDAIKEAATAYKVYYARVDLEGSEGEYLMNHSAFTYLMLPDGVAGLFRRDFPPSEIAAETVRILNARGIEG